MPPLVFLNMIVKNEESVIRRCLKSLTWIDGIFIADTGSTDKTPFLIEEWKQANKKKGTIVFQEWKNFGYNRTLCLKSAQKWLKEQNYDLTQVFFLFLDADMCFFGKSILPQLDESDLWDIPQENRMMKYLNLRFARASVEIEIKSPTHEYYKIITAPTTRKTFDQISIIDVGDGGCKTDKASRDIRLLKQGLEEEPDNLRYWFYLANTYKDIGELQNAIQAYEKRIESPGWYEELYCSFLYKGDCHSQLGEKEKASYDWVNAFNTDPCRTEALCRLAGLFRKDSKHHISMIFIEQGLKALEKKVSRMLFIEKPCYDYVLQYELSICGWYIGEKEIGKKACEHVLSQPNVPPPIIESCKKNLQFYQTKSEKES